MTTFSDIMASVFDRGARLIDWSERDGRDLNALTAALMSSRGEASGIALADQVLAQYAGLDGKGREGFFRQLADAFDPDPQAVREAAEAYAAGGTAAELRALVAATEPPRQELFRRLNMAPGGTARLVALRADLRTALRGDANLRRVDDDLAHLLGSWFNRGFLVLRPIDWNSPAAVLEKIIAYEAVHEIDSWDELRRRVDPPDRRCFAFFHPAMPDEPLIFVEVALTRETPGSIQALLDPAREVLDPARATTAVFYSISNCQPGLAGISFGAFLIKQVAHDLAAQLRGIETFVTLSPVPGLAEWLSAEAGREPDGDAALVISMLGDPGWTDDTERVETNRPRLRALAGQYFLTARRDDGQPLDPVARFHLGNGAELEAVHWPGDISARGLAQSGGVMVNYRYRLDRIEANHEAYATEGKVIASRAVRALYKG